MIYKKSQSDTAIVIFIFAFQAFLVIALGFLDVDVEQKAVGNDLLNFKENVITNLYLLEEWNLLLFTPLFIGLIYIIAKLIRGGG